MIKVLALPLSIIACVFAFFFYISPTYKETQIIKETEIPELEKKIAAEEEVTKNINSLAEDYSLNKEELKRLKYVLPEDQDIKSILVQLEALLLGNGMAYKEIGLEDSGSGDAGSIQMLAPGAVSANSFLAPSPSPVVVSLDLKGSYINLKKFIAELEVLDRVCNITSLEIGGEEGSVTATSTEGGTVNPATETPAEGLPDPELEITMKLEFYSQKPISEQEISQAFMSFQGATVGVEALTGVEGSGMGMGSVGGQ